MAKSNERNIRSTAAMKAASFPAPWVDSVLSEEGEGAPHFVARGFASRDKARQSGGYVEAKDVLAVLQAQLDAARKG